jgi:hypothetical protein
LCILETGAGISFEEGKNAQILDSKFTNNFADSNFHYKLHKMLLNCFIIFNKNHKDYAGGVYFN